MSWLRRGIASVQEFVDRQREEIAARVAARSGGSGSFARFGSENREAEEVVLQWETELAKCASRTEVAQFWRILIAAARDENRATETFTAYFSVEDGIPALGTSFNAWIARRSGADRARDSERGGENAAPPRSRGDRIAALFSDASNVENEGVSASSKQGNAVLSVFADDEKLRMARIDLTTEQLLAFSSLVEQSVAQYLLLEQRTGAEKRDLDEFRTLLKLLLGSDEKTISTLFAMFDGLIQVTSPGNTFEEAVVAFGKIIHCTKTDPKGPCRRSDSSAPTETILAISQQISQGGKIQRSALEAVDELHTAMERLVNARKEAAETLEEQHKQVNSSLEKRRSANEKALGELLDREKKIGDEMEILLAEKKRLSEELRRVNGEITKVRAKVQEIFEERELLERTLGSKESNTANQESAISQRLLLARSARDAALKSMEISSSLRDAVSESLSRNVSVTTSAISSRISHEKDEAQRSLVDASNRLEEARRALQVAQEGRNDDETLKQLTRIRHIHAEVHAVQRHALEQLALFDDNESARQAETDVSKHAEKLRKIVDELLDSGRTVKHCERGAEDTDAASTDTDAPASRNTTSVSTERGDAVANETHAMAAEENVAADAEQSAGDAIEQRGETETKQSTSDDTDHQDEINSTQMPQRAAEARVEAKPYQRVSAETEQGASGEAEQSAEVAFEQCTSVDTERSSQPEVEQSTHAKEEENKETETEQRAAVETEEHVRVNEAQSSREETEDCTSDDTHQTSPVDEGQDGSAEEDPSGEAKTEHNAADGAATFTEGDAKQNEEAEAK